MKHLELKSAKTTKLKKKEILSICKLKNTEWKYGIKSQLIWFKKNIKTNDIHNMAFFKKNLIGYNLLRKRSFLINRRKNFYLYFDTLIVLKKYRKMKIGKLLCELSSIIIKKKNYHSMLICKNELVNFYKKFSWKKKKKKNFEILDHIFPKNYYPMFFNKQKAYCRKKIKYFIFS